MNMADLQLLLKSLSQLLNRNSGKTPGGEFDAFCEGLEPFKDFTVPQFSKFIASLAEEYKKSGTISFPKAGGRRAAGAKKSAAAKKKTVADKEAVGAAVRTLEDLFKRAVDPTLTYPAIKEKIDQIENEFDKGGIHAVANDFGVRCPKAASKGEVRKKIEEKITDLKSSSERDRALETPLTSVQAQPTDSEADAVAEVVTETAQ
jgi:hypothetical protein